MQIKVNIEFQGSSEEVGLLLAQLGESVMGDDLEADVDETWWTSERAAIFVEGLTDPALQALAIIAAHAPKVSFRDLQQEMGMTGMQLAGRLSSIGFAVTRLDAQSPFLRDYHQRAYFMDEDVAKLIGAAISREQSQRTAKS